MKYRTNHNHIDDSLGATSRLTVALGAVLRVGDLLVFAGAGVLAWALIFGGVDLPATYWRSITIGTLFAALVFNGSALYRSWRGHGLMAEVFKLTTQWLLLAAVLAIYAVLVNLDAEISRAWALTWLITGGFGAVLLRLGVRGAASWMRHQGMDQRTAVVVGANPNAQRLVAALRKNGWVGIQVQGWFATEADRGKLNSVPKLGSIDDLGEYVQTNHIDQVWLALPLREQGKITAALNQLQYSTAEIKYVPDLFGMHLLNHSVENVVGLPVINLQRSPLQGPAGLIKAVEDKVLSALILLMISPLMLAVAIAVKLSSPGPVFYRQERISWNNRPFKMLKFRSMPVDAETKTGAVWAKAGENRATKVGAFLRKTSLDELPQFINVLKGDMSIVGPRPERPVFVEQFKHQIPAYMKKHMVKAGITGWAQVNGWRGSTDLKKRIECDLFYIENWSLLFDLRIILLTLFRGFVNKNAY